VDQTVDSVDTFSVELVTLKYVFVGLMTLKNSIDQLMALKYVIVGLVTLNDG